jgi:aspartate-semialdehyde dehydrogenase
VRVAIVGASGNVGTSLLSALERESAVDSIIGIARRAALEDGPRAYELFKKKEDGAIKVVLQP